jgi:hypothetical protein
LNTDGDLPCVHDGDAKRGERASEAEGERHDEQQPERDLMLSDGGKEHDEGRRAGDQTGGSAGREKSASPVSMRHAERP